MKKQFLFIAFACTTSLINAQSQPVPNGGFENWTNQGTFEDPQYWATMNLYTLAGAPATAIKSTDAHSGTYALKLKTVIAEVDGEMDTIRGIALLGSIDLSSGESTTGQPFTQRPDSLVGWYKLTSVDNAPFIIYSKFSRRNTSTNTTEEIGETLFQGAANSNYVRFSVPIVYTNNQTPDSLQIIISNSLDSTVISNVLLLDDLKFVYNNASTAGIAENTVQIQLAPNPVVDQLHIQSDQPVERISVKDIHGKRVFDLSGNNSEYYQVETAHFSPGIYFCELYFSNGSSKQVKFMKE